MDSNRVSFETESPLDQLKGRPERMPGMVRFVIGLTGGLVSNEKQANLVLIFFVLVVIVFAYFLTFNPNQPQPEIIRRRDQIAPEVRAQLPPGVWETLPNTFQ